jgi:hypothetical protein
VPTPTQSLIDSTVAPNTPSGIPIGAIVGIVFATIFVIACCLLFGYWVFVRRKSNQDPGSKLERKPTLNVLEKKYIVIMEYQPTASDEVKLSIGDIVILDLLFNDGWAKV